MGLLDALRSLFSSKPSRATDDAVHIFVECERCKARVHVRLDKRHDLSRGEGDGYFVRKEIMDSKCFRLMTAEIAFDAGYRIQSQELHGGRFLTKEAYEAAASSGEQATER